MRLREVFGSVDEWWQQGAAGGLASAHEWTAGQAADGPTEHERGAAAGNLVSLVAGGASGAGSPLQAGLYGLYGLYRVCPRRSVFLPAWPSARALRASPDAAVLRLAGAMSAMSAMGAMGSNSMGWSRLGASSWPGHSRLVKRRSNCEPRHSFAPNAGQPLLRKVYLAVSFR